MMEGTPTGYGVSVTLSAYNEPSRIGRLASALSPDLPLAFLCIEYAWRALGETIVVHAVDGSDDTVERTVGGRLPPRLTIV